MGSCPPVSFLWPKHVHVSSSRQKISKISTGTAFRLKKSLWIIASISATLSDEYVDIHWPPAKISPIFIYFLWSIIQGICPAHVTGVVSKRSEEVGSCKYVSKIRAQDERHAFIGWVLSVAASNLNSIALEIWT